MKQRPLEPRGTTPRLEIAVDTKSADVLICACNSPGEGLRPRRFTSGNIMLAIVKVPLEFSRKSENMPEEARG
jgi:hypothetical protein